MYSISMVRKVLTVDISDFETRKDEIASQLISAARDVGFFYIAGTGDEQYLMEYVPLTSLYTGSFIVTRARGHHDRDQRGIARTLLASVNSKDLSAEEMISLDMCSCKDADCVDSPDACTQRAGIGAAKCC